MNEHTATTQQLEHLAVIINENMDKLWLSSWGIASYRNSHANLQFFESFFSMSSNFADESS
jgi:hypothetical protein